MIRGCCASVFSPQAPHIDDFTNALTAGLDVIRQVMSQIGAWDDIQTLFEATAELRAAKDRVRGRRCCNAAHVPCCLALDVCMLVQVGDNSAVTVLALGSVLMLLSLFTAAAE